MNKEYKINVEFIVNETFYNDYEDILTKFENDLSSIGVFNVTTSEKTTHKNIFDEYDFTRELQLDDILFIIYKLQENKSIEINNTDKLEQDLQEILIDFKKEDE